MSVYKITKFLDKYALHVIIAFAFCIRFVGVQWGLPYLYHPDEHYVSDALRMIDTLDFNPHWLGHPGSFLMYSLVISFAIIIFFYFLCNAFQGYVYTISELSELMKSNSVFYFGQNPIFFYIMGRFINILFAVTTVYLVYAIAKKLFNKHVGLLASFCLAMAPLHIEYSRIVRADMSVTMLIMFSTYFLVRFLNEDDKKKSLIASSLCAGFAIAAKYVAAVMIIPILISSIIKDVQKKYAGFFSYIKALFLLKANVSKSLVLIFAGFFVFAPFVILDFKTALLYMNGELKIPYLSHESLEGMRNFLWYFKTALQTGVGRGFSGLFIEIFAALGFCIMLLRKSYREYVIFLFPVLFLITIGFGNLRWTHWAIPIIPFESILFGAGIYFSYKFILNITSFYKYKKWIFSFFAIVIIAVFYHTARLDFLTGARLCRLDKRTLAKHWIEKNIPERSTIFLDIYGPHLHVRPNRTYRLFTTAYEGIGSNPLSFYRKEGADYLVVSAPLKKKYYNEPKKYRKQVMVYESLKKKAELLKVFDDEYNLGPAIEIYKLK